MATLPSAPLGGDSNRGPGFIACAAITTTAASATVCLRLYVRIHIIHAVGWDDWTILAAMSMAILLLAFNSVEVYYGYGRHEFYLSPTEQLESTKYNILATAVVILGSCLAKVSICLFLLRLIGNAVAQKRKWFIYILILVLSVYNILDIITLFLQCSPTHKIWNRRVQGSCWHPKVQDGFAYMQGALAAFSAFVLSAFPMVILKDLQLNLRTKMAICLLLGLGVFDGVCSLVRTTLLPGFQASQDYSYTSVPIAIWAGLELTIAIIAASLPTIRPLFHFFDRTQHTSTTCQGRHRDPKHRERSHRLSLFSKRTGGQDEEYGVKSHDSPKQGMGVPEDDRSDKSTFPLRDPTSITKTTEIDISR